MDGNVASYILTSEPYTFDPRYIIDETNTIMQVRVANVVITLSPYVNQTNHTVYFEGSVSTEIPNGSSLATITFKETALRPRAFVVTRGNAVQIPYKKLDSSKYELEDLPTLLVSFEQKLNIIEERIEAIEAKLKYFE